MRSAGARSRGVPRQRRRGTPSYWAGLSGFGPVCLVGIEGTGSYGAGLSRHVTGAGVRVVEVDRSDRQDRRRQGKSDPLDAVSAARAALSGRARGAPRGRDGHVEAVRALMVAKRYRPLRADRGDQPGPGPGHDRARGRPDPVHPPHGGRARRRPAALRPRPGNVVGYPPASRCGRSAAAPSSSTPSSTGSTSSSVPLWSARAPGLLALYGVGPDTAALLLVTAGDHPDRLRSEAAWAHLCGAAPIPASSGKVTRHRLNRGGDRQANHALWRIVITRMSSHPPTRAYVARRSQGRPVQEGDHPLPQALRRPRGLPPPAPSLATQRLRGRPGPLIGCRTERAGLRNDPPAAPGPKPDLLGVT